MADFSDIAAPLLKLLSDDPHSESPPLQRVTTQPAGLSDTESPVGEDGEVVEIRPGWGEIPGFTRANISDAAIAAGREALTNAGLDVLAFYKSFRFIDFAPHKGKWGIFLFDAGIATVMSEYERQLSSLSPYNIQKTAIATLIHHEEYHFWIDCWTLSQEMWPVKAKKLKIYEPYLARLQSSASSDFDLEESLANYHMIRTIKQIKLPNTLRSTKMVRPTKMVMRFLDTCPRPYSEYEMEMNEKYEKEWRLAHTIHGDNVDCSNESKQLQDHILELDFPSAYSISYDRRRFPLKYSRMCPVHMIVDRSFTERMRPLEGPKRSEIIKFIEKYLNGSYNENSTDHAYYYIDNGKKVKIPNIHKGGGNISKDEFKNILHKAGMTRRQFENARQLTKNWKKRCPRKNY